MVLLNIMRRGCGMDELDWIGLDRKKGEEKILGLVLQLLLSTM